MRLTRLRAFALTVLLAAVLGLLPHAEARRSALPLADVPVSALPAEAVDLLVRIERGGPFRYERDGVPFGNREHMLPGRVRGYYHEYTVPTPGERSRGARRIVCGGAPAAPDACFYTDDHYQTFRRIVR